MKIALQVLSRIALWNFIIWIKRKDPKTFQRKRENRERSPLKEHGSDWHQSSISILRSTVRMQNTPLNHNQGLPWWRSGWESACQCRGHGFEPWSGKIPHAAEQLGPWATITEPVLLEPVLRNKRDRDSERPAHRNEEWPPLATTRESPRTETKTQHGQK